MISGQEEARSPAEAEVNPKQKSMTSRSKVKPASKLCFHVNRMHVVMEVNPFIMVYGVFRENSYCSCRGMVPGEAANINCYHNLTIIVAINSLSLYSTSFLHALVVVVDRSMETVLKMIKPQYCTVGIRCQPGFLSCNSNGMDVRKLFTFLVSCSQW